VGFGVAWRVCTVQPGACVGVEKSVARSCLVGAGGACSVVVSYEEPTAVQPDNTAAAVIAINIEIFLKRHTNVSLHVLGTTDYESQRI
jgi:hypothetical protein